MDMDEYLVLERTLYDGYQKVYLFEKQIWCKRSKTFAFVRT